LVRRRQPVGAQYGAQCQIVARVALPLFATLPAACRLVGGKKNSAMFGHSGMNLPHGI
jgi:hypothetical protein